MSNHDFEDLPCHNGHITIDAHNYLCGGTYVYDWPRVDNRVRKRTYLRYTFLKDVKCDECKKLKYEQLKSQL